jgi:hypothetical protein
MSHIAVLDWLNEEEMPLQPAPMNNSPSIANPTGGPTQNGPQVPDNADAGLSPNQDQPAGNNLQPPQNDDLSKDPLHPDMPEEKEDQNFEKWKNSYFKEAIRNDLVKMMDLIHHVRDEKLDPYERKFVEDNLQILFLRKDSNIDKASVEIRKKIKNDLDQNNPAVSIVNHVHSVLQTIPELNSTYIKLQGLLGSKGDLHRKFISALTGSVQVGSGGNSEDIIYNERDYSIRISTRFNEKWGKVEIGKWGLNSGDPEKFLTDPELKKLEDGSPEEKDVLRRRIIMESIAELFKQRAFLVNVVGEDGSIYTLGWDIAGSLRSAYSDGKLVVRTSRSESAEVMIGDDGSVIPLLDLKINYVKDTGRVNDEGLPESKELEFMQKINGILYLTANLNTLRNASSSFSGLVLKETPYSGNPSDLTVLRRCVPSVSEMLLRQC